MQNINGNDILKVKNEQIASIPRSYTSINKYVGSLRQIAQNLLKLSEEITNHINNGDITDQEKNGQLWHGLNNIEHQLKLFSTYTEDSVKEFSANTMQLVKTLQGMRPSK